MGRAGEGPALSQIKSLLQWGAAYRWTDRQLLEQFESGRDTSAKLEFAALNLACLIPRVGKAEREKEGKTLRRAYITRPDGRHALPSDP